MKDSFRGSERESSVQSTDKTPLNAQKFENTTHGIFSSALLFTDPFVYNSTATTF